MTNILRWLCILSIALAFFAGRSALASEAPERILFVGNSITYTNNLPAIYGVLTGGRVHADMFVKGGGRLADELGDQRLLDTIRDGHYKAVVIQEQGGLVLCSIVSELQSTQQCRDSQTAPFRLASLVKASGAEIFYLGTYQTDPATSHHLVRTEARLSKNMGARYVEISDTLIALHRKAPSLAWYYPTDLHPGPLLTTLMAVKIYKAMYNKSPAPQELCTSFPLFGPKDHFDGFVDQEGKGVKDEGRNCVASARDIRWIVSQMGKLHGSSQKP